MRYQVLIVDDELHVRERVMQSFPWFEMGFEVMACAENGLKAWELIEAEAPHVVVTDLLMPEMNGLELVKRIREKYPYMKVVIMSAYDDFKYAQDAIRYGVKGYVLKPIARGEFIELCRSLADELRRDDLDEREMSRKEAQLIRLLKGADADEQRLAAQLEQTSMLGRNRYVRIAICSMEQLMKKEPGLSVRQRIVKKANELCSQRGIPVILYGNTLVLFIHDSKPLAKSDVLPFLESFKNEMEHVEDGQATGEITIGVGNMVQDVTAIALSYAEAIYAHSNRYFKGLDTIIFRQDLFVSNVADATARETVNEAAERLLHSIFQFRAEEIGNRVYGFFQALERAGFGIRDIQVKCVEMIMRIVLKAEERQLVMPTFNQQEALDAIHNLRTLYELKVWFKMKAEAIALELRAAPVRDVNRTIVLAKQYVEAHYRQKIKLEDVAGALHVNITYLSSFFKKETGQNFIDYINEVRIKKAMELMKNVDYKVFEVSIRVGFNNLSYFNKIFKKIVGVNPMVYREDVTRRH
ncbi:response regulator [Paenibacillus cymbidii]|uniref:response regulator n=1 Tax=Paenibacillus cymbidii TaxID=1639034 RepID=UPI0010810AE5|nr:response regulator [Paenibacillus cymbidii]